MNNETANRDIKKHVASKAEKKAWKVFRGLTDLELVSIAYDENDNLDRGMATCVLEERQRKRQWRAQVLTVILSAFVGLVFGLLSTWISSCLFEKNISLQQNGNFCVSCGKKLKSIEYVEDK